MSGKPSKESVSIIATVIALLTAEQGGEWYFGRGQEPNTFQESYITEDQLELQLQASNYEFRIFYLEQYIADKQAIVDKFNLREDLEGSLSMADDVRRRQLVEDILIKENQKSNYETQLIMIGGGQ